MRYLWLITRVALPAASIAAFLGGIKHGYGFSGGR
jgi:hypothetical protein